MIGALACAESPPGHGKAAIDGKAYVCIDPQCSAAITDATVLMEAVRPHAEKIESDQ